MNCCRPPAVSVVLPVYNGERFLESAINSVVAQTFEDFELIIVDDCSTDRTAEIIKNMQLKDGRIRSVRNDKNKKLPASLNAGFAHSRGRYLTWTSDDNILDKNALTIMVNEIRKGRADVVWCDYYKIDQSGKCMEKTDFSKFALDALLFRNIIGACFLYKRRVQERLNGYRENQFLVEDYDFWIRAYKEGFHFKYIPETPYYYRFHAGALTETRKKEISSKITALRRKNLLACSARSTKSHICLSVSETYFENREWIKAAFWRALARFYGMKGREVC